MTSLFKVTLFAKFEFISRVSFHICIPNLLAKINAKSHCLQYYDLSPEWVFICVPNLLAKKMQSHIVCNITIYLQSEFSYMYPQLTRQKKCKVTLIAILRFISKVNFHMYLQITRQNQCKVTFFAKIPCCCCRIDHCQRQRSQAHRGSSYLNIPQWAWAGTAGCPSSQMSRKTSRFEMFSYDHVGKEVIFKKNVPYVLVCHGQFSSFVHIS